MVPEAAQTYNRVAKNSAHPLGMYYALCSVLSLAKGLVDDHTKSWALLLKVKTLERAT